jgi:hypothetical protein
MKCDICKNEIEKKRDPETGKVYWEEGHNAEPVVENGRCCDHCNYTVVIPTRLGIITKKS